MDKKFSKKNMWKLIGYGFFALMIIAILCVRFLYGSVIAVSGSSMVPTFQDTDYVFATILQDDDELAVGDIVILEEDGIYLIKRIAAMPGDTLQPDYVKSIPELTMGEDEYYVLGDNWKVSRDSRMFGPISRDDIQFKYAGVHWTRWGMIISLLLPTILFIAQLSIVFIPADKKKKEEKDEACDKIEMTDPDYVDEDEFVNASEEPVQEITLHAQSDTPDEPVQPESSTVN